MDRRPESAEHAGGRGRKGSDLALGEFVLKLDDQLGSNGKYLGRRDRYLPTRTTHCACGDVNHDLTHNDREWKCRCGATVNSQLSSGMSTLH